MYIALAIMILMIVGCVNTDISDAPGDIDLPIVGMTIVKMTAPEYLDYVICDKMTVPPQLSEGSNDDSYNVYGIRGYGRCVQELYLGKNPYITLEDGYYLVDWKWGHYIYPPTNKLIDVLWTDVEDRLQQWDLQTEILSDSWRDIFEIVGYTDRKSVDVFLQIDSLPEFLEANISKDQYDPFNSASFLMEHNSIQQIMDSVFLVEYLDEVAKQDSLQNVYIERLNQIICQKALEEVSYIF